MVFIGLAVAANDGDACYEPDGTSMFSLVILNVVDDVVANDIVVDNVVGLSDAAHADIVYDGGTDVDVTYAGARVDVVTTPEINNNTSLATIIDLCVVENDTAARSVTYEHQTIIVPDFNVSQEVNDYMEEDGVQEECRPGDVPNWYDDNDDDYIPSAMDDNDQSDILFTKDII